MLDRLVNYVNDHPLFKVLSILAVFCTILAFLGLVVPLISWPNGDEDPVPTTLPEPELVECVVDLLDLGRLDGEVSPLPSCPQLRISSQPPTKVGAEAPDDLEDATWDQAVSSCSIGDQVEGFKMEIFADSETAKGWIEVSSENPFGVFFDPENSTHEIRRVDGTASDVFGYEINDYITRVQLTVDPSLILTETWLGKCAEDFDTAIGPRGSELNFHWETPPVPGSDSDPTTSTPSASITSTTPTELSTSTSSEVSGATYSFESGVEGWMAGGICPESVVSQSDLHPRTGRYSLALELVAEWPERCEVEVIVPADPPPGNEFASIDLSDVTIECWVLVPDDVRQQIASGYLTLWVNNDAPTTEASFGDDVAIDGMPDEWIPLIWYTDGVFLNKDNGLAKKPASPFGSLLGIKVVAAIESAESRLGTIFLDDCTISPGSSAE